MKSPTHYRALLAHETAHLVAEDRRQVAAMLRDALEFAARYPAAPVDMIAVKLMTLHDGAERWTRRLIALAARETVAQPLAA